LFEATEQEKEIDEVISQTQDEIAPVEKEIIIDQVDDALDNIIDAPKGQEQETETKNKEKSSEVVTIDTVLSKIT